MAPHIHTHTTEIGFSYNDRVSPEPSPQSNYRRLSILYNPSGSKSSADSKDRPTISVRQGRPSQSISAYIPTSSLQFSGPLKLSSPISPGSHPLHKRSRSRSSDSSSGPSDKTHYDQESEGESAAVPAPAQKRRREEKKHQCPYCKKLFHRPVSLGVHINTHTGDKRMLSGPLYSRGALFPQDQMLTFPL